VISDCLGAKVSLDKLAADHLSTLLDEVLSNSTYRDNSRKIQKAIAEANGLSVAADLVEESLESQRRLNASATTTWIRPSCDPVADFIVALGEVKFDCYLVSVLHCLLYWGVAFGAIFARDVTELNHRGLARAGDPSAARLRALRSGSPASR